MERQWVLGCPVDLQTPDVILQRMEEAMGHGDRLRIVTLNPEMVMAARHNKALASAVGNARCVVPDGVGVIMALRRRGVHAQRITGVDLAEMMMQRLASQGGIVFLLGGRPGVAQLAGERLCKRFPGLNMGGYADGYFDEEREELILTAIRHAKPHLLLVGMGVPRQEIWLSSHWEQMATPVAMGIGGGLDLWAGAIQRAPCWMQGMGLEWLFRVIQEPWRLRRLGVLPGFVVHMLLERREERNHV